MGETRAEKYPKYLCEHEKYKYSCKECKGSQVCSHNRQKYQCKECKGTQVCPHNRQKSHCKECKGSQLSALKAWLSDEKYPPAAIYGRALYCGAWVWVSLVTKLLRVKSEWRRVSLGVWRFFFIFFRGTFFAASFLAAVLTHRVPNSLLVACY